jgi:hypothetical protein
MTKLKAFALTTIVAASIGVGGLATAPPASAAINLSCAKATQLADLYTAHGDSLYVLGNHSGASYWYGRAVSVMQGAC